MPKEKKSTPESKVGKKCRERNNIDYDGLQELMRLYTYMGEKNRYIYDIKYIYIVAGRVGCSVCDASVDMAREQCPIYSRVRRRRSGDGVAPRW